MYICICVYKPEVTHDAQSVYLFDYISIYVGVFWITLYGTLYALTTLIVV